MGTKPSVASFDLWKKAHNVTLTVFKVGKDVREDEREGFVGPFRQCAIEVVHYITFAYLERNPKERVNFYKEASLSVEKLKYFCELAKELGYLKGKMHLFDKIEEIGKIVNSNIYKFTKDFT